MATTRTSRTRNFDTKKDYTITIKGKNLKRFLSRLWRADGKLAATVKSNLKVKRG